MIVETLVAVVARPMIKARWSLRTMAIVAEVVGTDGCEVCKGFTRKSRQANV